MKNIILKSTRKGSRVRDNVMTSINCSTTSKPSSVVANYDQSVLAVAGDAEAKSKSEDTAKQNRETKQPKQPKDSDWPQ